MEKQFTFQVKLCEKCQQGQKLADDVMWLKKQNANDLANNNLRTLRRGRKIKGSQKEFKRKKGDKPPNINYELLL